MKFSVRRPSYNVSTVACNAISTLLWESKFIFHIRNVSLGCLWYDELQSYRGGPKPYPPLLPRSQKEQEQEQEEAAAAARYE